MAEHAKPARRDRLLPALVLIVACGLLEVWTSWLSIGAVSGFSKLGRMTTGWVLPVTAEAYWTAALYAWLVDPAGPRSRKFGMVTAVLMFALSLAGQEGGHLVSAADRPERLLVAGLATALPLIAVALGAVLIHLRHLDREESAAAERARLEAGRQAAIERAEADERTALRGELNALTERLAATEAASREAELRAADAGVRLKAAEALRPEMDALAERLAEAETARNKAAQRAETAEAEAGRLTRKLAAADKRKTPARKPAASPRTTPQPAPETEMPEDFDAQAEALRILAEEPDISGAKLAERVGRSERWGQMFKSNLAKTTTPTDVVDGKGPADE